ncbi:hypothetical protein AB0I69_19930 [Streptomyces sp. NPDC050508]|uniref:hypothetical protein n=1 Tax=Streptomyces sp. NPDC050508 TaxID=3155405 RepID=UPI0034286AFB
MPASATPVTPGSQTINYPQQVSTESFQLFGYPLATVIAEKLSTAVSLGDLNNRDLSERRQTSYIAWRRRQGPAATDFPERFVDVVRQVTAFADVLLNDDTANRTRSAATLTWP